MRDREEELLARALRSAEKDRGIDRLLARLRREYSGSIQLD